MDPREQDFAETLLITKEGYDRLQAELTTLTVDKRAEIAERLRASQEHGEFADNNSELDEVKVEQALIETRISELRAILSLAEVLETRKISTKNVGIGSRVTLKDLDRNSSFEVRLVSTVEADPEEDLISEESPLGAAIADHEVGDIIEYEAPAGKIRYEIVRIRK